MPPKPKFNQEEILDAAFQLARKNGIEAVKAREVGQKLGCSSRPIFTFFSGMEDLQNAVLEKAEQLFLQYLHVADDYDLAFKMRGFQMIRFAKEEPNLFRILFMQKENGLSFRELVQTKTVHFESDLADIQQNYGVTKRDAERLFSHLLLHAISICTLCANQVCSFTEDEVLSLLGETFAGSLMLLKSGVAQFAAEAPAPKGNLKNRPKNFPFPAKDK